MFDRSLVLKPGSEPSGSSAGSASVWSGSTLDVDAASGADHVARPLHPKASPSPESSIGPLLAAYQQWKASSESSSAVPEMQRSVTECEAELESAKARLPDMGVQRKDAKREQSLMKKTVEKVKRSDSHADRASRRPESLSADVVLARNNVEKLQRRLDTLTDRLKALNSVASMLDECYDVLRSAMKMVSLPSGQHHDAHEELLRAEKSLAEAEVAYSDTQQTTKILQCAELAIQSAHHHYKEAMNHLDAVCGPRGNVWEKVIGDDLSKEATYRDAAKWAEKAQICFDECVRVFEAHRDLLGNEPQECEELKEIKLLQAVQIFHLNYGGKVLQFGITTQMRIMLQKQEAVFERLTSFAVWVQNYTKNSESVNQSMRVKRDVARRKFVAVWMKERLPEG